MSFFKSLFGAKDDYHDQLSAQSLKQMWATLPSVPGEIWQVIEPGAHVRITEAWFIPNMLQEFNLDESLGILHGRGKGHAFFRLSALRRVLSPHITDYEQLVKAFRSKGYTIKRIDYVSFEPD